MTTQENITKIIEKKFSLAVENFKKDSFQEAQILFEEILKINPNHAETYYNLGLIYQELREFNKSKEFYQKAIQIKSDYVDAHNNLGLIFRELNDLKSAKHCYQKAIDFDPNCVMALFNLGIIFRELAEFKNAIKCYQKVIKISPNLIKAHNNIGNVFKKMREDDKAISHFESALKLNPSSVDAQVNISNVYISQLDNLNSAVESSYKALKMFKQKIQLTDQSVLLYRLKHDLQQANYLSFKNYKIEGIKEFIKTGNEILNRDENKEENNDSYKKIALRDSEVNSLLPFYRANYIYQTQDISEGYINPYKNWKDIENEYFNSDKQIIYIDNFLSEKAIREMQKFCLISKIWVEERRNKYLGSFSDKGFVSPLHLQIAIELKNKLPNLFGKHRLGRFWGFKYDSTLGKGINIHADFALINLNFWITPDEFNNDKNRGGLKVYDILAPEDWTFQKYNINADEIYKLLKKNKANCVNVPYKFNRAVLFNSDYFHETDQINFKDEYEARRINITYLFGDRLFKNK